jgi:hypothetical protein
MVQGYPSPQQRRRDFQYQNINGTNYLWNQQVVSPKLCCQTAAQIEERNHTDALHNIVGALFFDIHTRVPYYIL